MSFEQLKRLPRLSAAVSSSQRSSAGDARPLRATHLQVELSDHGRVLRDPGDVLADLEGQRFPGDLYGRAKVLYSLRLVFAGLRQCQSETQGRRWRVEERTCASLSSASERRRLESSAGCMVVTDRTLRKDPCLPVQPIDRLVQVDLCRRAPRCVIDLPIVATSRSGA